jgi:hypothetical protein
MVPRYGRSEGTDNAPLAEPPSERAVRVSQWLRSQDARPYDNQWVLLSDEYEVLDADASARALVSRHAGVADPLVVFVQAPRVHFG